MHKFLLMKENCLNVRTISASWGPNFFGLTDEVQEILLLSAFFSLRLTVLFRHLQPKSAFISLSSKHCRLRPRVHKETENEDQAQDQIDKCP